MLGLHSSFYLAQDPGPWNGATHIEGENLYVNYPQLESRSQIRLKVCLHGDSTISKYTEVQVQLIIFFKS